MCSATGTTGAKTGAVRIRGRSALLSLILLVLLELCFGMPTAHATFRPGPVVLDEAPEGLGEPLNWAPKKALAREVLPPPLVEAARGVLAGDSDVVLVGYTDSVGPRLLNQSLGLQYAVDAAHRLSVLLDAPPRRFICVSRGERDDREEGGVELFSMEPPPPPPPPAARAINILSPPPNGDIASRLWAIWDTDASRVVWANREGEKVRSWELVTSDVESVLPFPSRNPASALGAQFSDTRWVHGGEWQEPEVREDLALTIETSESGWSRLSARVAPGYRDLVVWAGGIPYPVNVESGKFDVNVVRYAPGLMAYTQAVDPKGRVVTGPELPLPASLAQSPRVLAVLTWEGEEADLDLHGWVGTAHTRPQDPDPSYSRTAARGVRLLFDGDGRQRVSALWVDTDKAVDIEVHCFNDFGGGARALLYLLLNPGDAVLSTGRILGPRQMNKEPLWQRWPAVRLKGE